MTQNALACWYRARRNLSGASHTLGNVLWLNKVQGLDTAAFPPAAPNQVAAAHGITNGEWIRRLLYRPDEDGAPAEDPDALAKALDEWYTARREFTKARHTLTGAVLPKRRYDGEDRWERVLRHIRPWQPATIGAVAAAMAADFTERHRVVRRGDRALHASVS
jgi:hypothetical protein